MVIHFMLGPLPPKINSGYVPKLTYVIIEQFFFLLHITGEGTVEELRSRAGNWPRGALEFHLSHGRSPPNLKYNRFKSIKTVLDPKYCLREITRETPQAFRWKKIIENCRFTRYTFSDYAPVARCRRVTAARGHAPTADPTRHLGTFHI